MNGRTWLWALLLAWPFQALDDAAREAVLRARTPAGTAAMQGVTSAGRPLLVVASVAALAAGPASRALLLEAAVVLAPVNLVVEALKWCVNRARPDGDTRRRNSSFPSSHAANAFAVAALLWRRWKRSAWITLPIASLVALSRLVVDRHWLTDVVFGAVLACGMTLWLASSFSGWRSSRRAAMVGSARD